MLNKLNKEENEQQQNAKEKDKTQSTVVFLAFIFVHNTKPSQFCPLIISSPNKG